MEQQKKKYVYSLVDSFEGPKNTCWDENEIMRGTLEECREKMPNVDQLRREIQTEQRTTHYSYDDYTSFVYKIYKIGIITNDDGEEEEDVNNIEEVERIQMTVEEAFRSEYEEEEEEEE